MQLDFRTHKKTKKFPYPVLGVILSLALIGLFVYFTKNNIPLESLIRKTAAKEFLDVYYFGFIIINTLLFLFSLAMVFQLRGNMKILLVLSLFSYCLSGILAGYFYENVLSDTLMRIYYISALSFFIFYLLTVLFQNRTFSKYTNPIIIVISSLSIIPLAIICIMILSQSGLEDNLIITVNYFYLLSLLLYALSNSIYIFQLNRKV
ncbi:MAG: hypothetical protein JXQ23_03920 [Clostridia bacterium]|nr:hypothetical protein [Clostridia bacterium]